MSASITADVERLTATVTNFVVELAKEGERSAVVLGAARLDVSLEYLLKKVILHHPGGSDNLFDPDRPLGSFAAKVALSYRLGLIDRDVEHAIQMVRKIRNDFAHSIARSSLSESNHKSRVEELAKECQKSGELFTKLLEALTHVIPLRELATFCTSIAVILTRLETSAMMSEPFKVNFVAKLA